MKTLLLVFGLCILLLAVPVAMIARAAGPDLATPVPFMEWIAWILSGGMGVLAYYLIDHIAWLANQPASGKRLWAFLLSLVIGSAAFAVSVALRASPMPAEPMEWIAMIWGLVSLCFTVSQGAHALLTLPKAEETKEVLIGTIAAQQATIQRLQVEAHCVRCSSESPTGG